MINNYKNWIRIINYNYSLMIVSKSDIVLSIHYLWILLA